MRLTKHKESVVWVSHNGLWLEPCEIASEPDNIKTISSIMSRLAAYEDAEQERRLTVLPCKIGTHLWRITTPYRGVPQVTEYVVKNFRTAGKRHRLQLEVQAVNVPDTNWMEFSRFFTSYEEAENVLKAKVNNE